MSFHISIYIRSNALYHLLVLCAARNLNQTESGLFAHVLTASPQTFSVVEQVGFWPQRDKEKIKFRLSWIHWKKMWSCSCFLNSNLYMRWDMNMIFDWYLILFPFCFRDPLYIHISFTISLWFQHTTLPPKMLNTFRWYDPLWHSFTWWVIKFGQELSPMDGISWLKILLPVWDRCLGHIFTKHFRYLKCRCSPIHAVWKAYVRENPPPITA